MLENFAFSGHASEHFWIIDYTALWFGTTFILIHARKAAACTSIRDT